MYMGTEVEELFLLLVNNWPGRHQTTIRYEQKQKMDLQKFSKKKNQSFKMPKLSVQGKTNIETDSLLRNELLRHQCVPGVSWVSCA